MKKLLLDAVVIMIKEQKKKLALLSEVLKINTSQIFYAWAKREINQSGSCNKWKYFFHGLECDFRNIEDKRFLRLDFGPKGRIDTFTEWGLLQFIRNSCKPWPEFIRIKNELSFFDSDINVTKTKLSLILKQLKNEDLIVPSDLSLSQFAKENTYINNEGLKHLELPKDFPDHKYFDILVSNRLLISEKGFKFLKKS